MTVIKEAYTLNGDFLDTCPTCRNKFSYEKRRIETQGKPGMDRDDFCSDECYLYSKTTLKGAVKPGDVLICH